MSWMWVIVTVVGYVLVGVVVARVLVRDGDAFGDGDEQLLAVVAICWPLVVVVGIVGAALTKLGRWILR